MFALVQIIITFLLSIQLQQVITHLKKDKRKGEPQDAESTGGESQADGN